MTHIFDGRSFAQSRMELLGEEVKKIKVNGINPKLCSILVGNDSASNLYVNLKKKKGEGIGIEVEIMKLSDNVKPEKLINIIKKLNIDKKVHGVMVQLPLPKSFSENDREVITNSINFEKDVDGLREESLFTAPVVRSIEEIIGVSEKYLPHDHYPYQIVVVGANGFVGRKVIKRLEKYNPRVYSYLGLDIKDDGFRKSISLADIVISATGVANLIKMDMVKRGVVLIDVGSPCGDIEKKAYEKSVFASPVPGGVGPVTVACLLENLVQSAEKLQFNVV